MISIRLFIFFDEYSFPNIFYTHNNRKIMKIRASTSTLKPNLRTRNFSNQKPQASKSTLPVIHHIFFNLDENPSSRSDFKTTFIPKHSKQQNMPIQEIQLDNSKWLIFNDQRDDRNADYVAPSSFKRQLAPKLKKNGKFKGRRMTTNQNTHGVALGDKNEKQNSRQAKQPESARKSPQRPEKANKSKRINLHVDFKQHQRERNSPKSSKFMNGNKSNRSYKSLKSVESSKAIKTPKKKTEVKIELKEEEVVVVPLPGLIENIVKEEGKDVKIVRLFNEVEMLYNNFGKGFTTNIYDDFPQWASSLPVVLAKPIPQERQMPVTDQYEKKEDHSWKNDQISKFLHSMTGSIIQNLKIQQIINKIEQDRHIVEKQQEQTYENKASQCMTTKATEIDSHDKKEEKSLPLQNNQISTKQVSFKDLQFNILREFTAFNEVRLIKIDPNPQTALFPCKFITQFIRPIPSTSQLHNQYRNDQMISFLNHILFAEPAILFNVFEKPSKCGYKCNLFEKSEVTKVVVDGYIPFDANYYPLFGYFDQFIWFSVLIKSIAKLKGSYKALKSLQACEIFQLLTGSSLLNLQFDYQDHKALKDFKLIHKSAQTKSAFMTVRKNDNFYKIMKIESNKVMLKPKLNRYRSCNSMKNQSGSNEDNYKCLSTFLQKEKKIYQKNEIFENTTLYLKGFQSKRKMTFRQFAEQGFQVYVSDKIQKNTERHLYTQY